GENSQPHNDTYGDACNQQSCWCPRLRPPRGSPAGQQAGAGQDRPAEACEVGVSISSNLQADLKDPEHRKEDHDVSQPCCQQARHSPAKTKTSGVVAKTRPVLRMNGSAPGITVGGQLVKSERFT